MILHLVGGFLGSGKTTAITNSTELLKAKNVKTSIITNDQGNYLVDSRYVEKYDVPFSEVTGGCFCCNYNKLDSQINTLKEKFDPSVIFCESVGSCTDLIATVLKPLLKFRESDIEKITFSTFVDSQLLLKYVQGQSMPFSIETNYIWEKQIEEAEILVVNKVDLLANDEMHRLKVLAKDSFPLKKLLFQNSLDKNSISKWLTLLDNKEQNSEHKSINVDYQKYGAGEANLAWLDEEIEIVTKDNSSVDIVKEFIQKLTSEIADNNFPIGHLKFYLSVNKQYHKISYTTVMNGNSELLKITEKSNSVDLLVNARIHSTPEDIRTIFINELDQLKSRNEVEINEKHLSYFQPGFPEPTHRMI